METDEYLKLAEVEDRMWYFRSLHAHIDRVLTAEWQAGANGGGGPFKLLDAGCGTGGLILRLRAAHPEWHYTGVDLMPLAHRLAQQRCGPGVDLRVASVAELPFCDGAFDAVASADVLCQLERAAPAAAELFRVLRPGGIAAINVPAYMWMWSYHDERAHAKHRFARGEVAALLQGAGFRDVRTTHWNALPFPAIWLKRKVLPSRGDTSDVRLYPGPVEALFDALTKIEHAWIARGGRWAWGTSVFAVARKP